ncbi:hypothetical protein COOONC_13516 [Cooperia oncophora]
MKTSPAHPRLRVLRHRLSQQFHLQPVLLNSQKLLMMRKRRANLATPRPN